MGLLSVLFSQTWTEVQLNHKIRAKHKQNQNIASKYIRCYEPIGFCSIPSEMGSYRIIHRRQAVKHTHTQKRHYAACSKQFNFQSIPFPNWLLFRKLSSLVWLKRPMGDAKAKQNRKRKIFWPFFLVRKNSLKMNNHFFVRSWGGILNVWFGRHKWLDRHRRESSMSFTVSPGWLQNKIGHKCLKMTIHTIAFELVVLVYFQFHQFINYLLACIWLFLLCKFTYLDERAIERT